MKNWNWEFIGSIIALIGLWGLLVSGGYALGKAYEEIFQTINLKRAVQISTGILLTGTIIACIAAALRKDEI